MALKLGASLQLTLREMLQIDGLLKDCVCETAAPRGANSRLKLKKKIHIGRPCFTNMRTFRCLSDLVQMLHLTSRTVRRSTRTRRKEG